MIEIVTLLALSDVSDPSATLTECSCSLNLRYLETDIHLRVLVELGLGQLPKRLPRVMQ